jgi:hypothetical protein
MFGLEAGAGLGGTPVPDLDRAPAEKELSAIGVYRHQRIGFIQIDTNRMNTLWLWNAQGEGDAPYQFALSQDDVKAINLNGIREEWFEACWNGVVQMLSACYRPDGKCPIPAEVGITPATSYQEEGAVQVSGWTWHSDRRH